ncbi:hypothetical protein TrVE_jg3180 [Triparma verrucosa]|uniref:SRCR domain-containing protein n=1 Tax=Triparma verrucosa TaxID=1606542 RepID=A0A9W7EZ60_9STRA|nr:hypothetical protein TrVE_jg3180 [Triparma verrucosa]
MLGSPCWGEGDDGDNAPKIPCARGRYNPYSSANSQEACLPCEEGKISSKVGESSCRACTGSAVSSSDSTSCFCSKGSGNQLTTGRIQDTSKARLIDQHGHSPVFNRGSVSGRIEVKPSGKSKFGGIWPGYDGTRWDDADARVACRQIGDELGYVTVNGLKLSDTPQGSNIVWWKEMACMGDENILEECEHEELTLTWGAQVGVIFNSLLGKLVNLA